MEPVHANEHVYDSVGVGWGPSNIALAIATRELAPGLDTAFFERSSCLNWHPGLLFPDSRMQISFLKDLVTLRNPASPYTFLQYLHAVGRLERFVNLRDFHPTRLEYVDYLRWVAGHFEERVHYGTAVRRVLPAGSPACFRIETEVLATGERSSCLARNVVVASGGVPHTPEGCNVTGRRTVHSAAFLPTFYEQFTDTAARHKFVVVGDGQSAGEIVVNLQRRYPNARVHMLVRGHAPRPADSSPFVNEMFSSAEARAFYEADPAHKLAIREEQRGTNYGVIDADVLRELYSMAYASEVRGERLLSLHRHTQVVSAVEEDDHVDIVMEDRCTHARQALRCDAVVFATGYTRRLDPEIYGEVLPLLQHDDGQLGLAESYRVRTKVPMPCGLYVQGFAEASHGLGDTLLSLLPFRSRDIVTDIDREVASRSTKAPSVASYPPRHHVDEDEDNAFALISQYPLATLVSARGPDDALVTVVPLILDRNRGERGTLFGHMDRANPQAKVLDGRRLLAVFRGPDSYISPHVYTTDQLPTWNSMVVHVRGRIRVLTDQSALVRGLASICEHVDRAAGAYRLDPADPRIGRLIDFIVGFELEIEEVVARFKLSQDRNDEDRRRAAAAMLSYVRSDVTRIVESTLGVRLDPSRRPPEVHATIDPSVCE